MLLVGGVFLGCALITIAFARPLILRRVPPNQIYGLKLKATYADEWVWYEANEASGRDALKWAVAQIAAVFVPLLFLRPTSWTTTNLDRAGVVYVVINLIVCVGGAVAICIVGAILANRLLGVRMNSGADLKPEPPGL